MTREDAKQLLPIIQAFSDGKDVETKTGSGWISIENMSFAGKPNNYRIKPEPKYRPFKNAEECWTEMQKHQPIGWIKGKEGWYHSLITSIIADEEEVYINGISGFVLDDIMEHYTFSDGTPFGILEEE